MQDDRSGGKGSGGQKLKNGKGESGTETQDTERTQNCDQARNLEERPTNKGRESSHRTRATH